jgi:hypothetical protein
MWESFGDSKNINLDRFRKYLSLFADLDGMLKVDKVSTTFNNQRLCLNKETLNFPNYQITFNKQNKQRLCFSNTFSTAKLCFNSATNVSVVTLVVTLVYFHDRGRYVVSRAKKKQENPQSHDACSSSLTSSPTVVLLLCQPIGLCPAFSQFLVNVFGKDTRGKGFVLRSGKF